MTHIGLTIAASIALASGAATQLQADPNASKSLPPSKAAAVASMIALGPPAPTRPLGTPELGAWGVETQYIDKSVKPGDDFFTYVNGGWVKAAKIPQGLPGIDSLTALTLKTEAQTKEILALLNSRQFPANSPEGQIRALHRSYMDEKRLEALGVTPLKPELDAIFKATSHSELSRLMGQSMISGIMSGGALLDDHNPERYIVVIAAEGLSMPSREFYLEQGGPFPAFRTAYLAYVEELLGLGGIDNAKARAAEIMAFETELARLSWTATQRRDKVKLHHVMKMTDLPVYAPGFDWKAMLDEFGAPDAKEVSLRADTQVRDWAALFGKTSVKTLQSHLAFRTLNGNSSALSPTIEAASFKFFGTVLQGAKEQRAREDQAIQVLNGGLGEPLGKIYVDRYFPAASKAEVNRMIGFMRTAMRERLGTLKWMDDQTRAEAGAKLDSFGVKIGYPDQWHDMSSIEVRSDDLFGNLRRIARWQRQEGLARLKEPKRQWEWEMKPQEINAYYFGERNEIVFTAGILQAPYFDLDADPAVNFGSVAAVIGHEIGHGFDDQGSRSDAKGLIRDWWTPASRAEFEKRATVLVNQYDQYEVIPGAKVNGQLTLGENIGDLSGISIAYEAWKRYEKENYGGKAPVIDGFTGDQRFFLGWAQLWRVKATDEFHRQRVLTDNHSPGQFRINGIVRNFGPWYEAFGVKPGDKLYLPPEQRVAIW